MIINPEFCWDSPLPSLCRGLWDLIEITGITIAVYYLFVKKRRGET